MPRFWIAARIIIIIILFPFFVKSWLHDLRQTELKTLGITEMHESLPAALFSPTYGGTFIISRSAWRAPKNTCFPAKFSPPQGAIVTRSWWSDSLFQIEAISDSDFEEGVQEIRQEWLPEINTFLKENIESIQVSWKTFFRLRPCLHVMNSFSRQTHSSPLMYSCRQNNIARREATLADVTIFRWINFPDQLWPRYWLPQES